MSAEIKERTSILGYLCDPKKFLTLSKLNRSTDHDCQDGVDILGGRVPILLKPLREILLVTKHPRQRANDSGHGQLYRRNVSGQQTHKDDSETYTLGNASTSISFDVVENLPDLGIDLVLSSQHLASLDVKEAEGIDRIESVEELRFRECLYGVILRFLECNTGLRKERYFRSAAETMRRGGVTHNLCRDPLNRHNSEDVPDNVQGTLLVTHQLVRLLGDKSLRVLIEELGDGVNLLWGLRQRLEYLPLFPLPPFGCIGGKEKPWTMDDLGDPVQEWMPELLLVPENSGNFPVLLEHASTVGSARSLEVVLVLLVQFRQNFTHGQGSHEREPGVDTVIGELLREGTKEESTEHGTKPGVLWRPHAIGITPGSEVVWCEVGSEEAVSTNKSNGVGKDGTRYGVARAKSGTLDNWFGVLGLEASVKFKMVD